MINRNQYYYKIMLTDNASGRLLFESTGNGLRNIFVYGNVIIEANTLHDVLTISCSFFMDAGVRL
jgi:hypothetical protein